MAVYTRYQKDLTLEERYIYGSSRVGAEYPNDVLASVNFATNIHVLPFDEQRVGDKRYELSNHLGNVLEVITDRKLAEDNGLGGVDFYTADVVSYSDYYPFGMMLPGRSGSASDYKFGYQGYECDPEIKGAGNSYTTHFRQYDPRIGRWICTDPKASAWESPYVGMGNNPNFYIDRLGDTLQVMGDDASKAAFLGYVNEGLGGFYTASFQGDILILTATDKEGQMTEEQQNFHTSINSAANLETSLVCIGVTSNGLYTVDSYDFGEIDVSQLEQFEGLTLTSPQAHITHFLYEQVQKQRNGTNNFDLHHANAIRAENAVQGTKRKIGERWGEDLKITGFSETYGYLYSGHVYLDYELEDGTKGVVSYEIKNSRVVNVTEHNSKKIKLD